MALGGGGLAGKLVCATHNVVVVFVIVLIDVGGGGVGGMGQPLRWAHDAHEYEHACW